jgi:hypothetical protein
MSNHLGQCKWSVLSGGGFSPLSRFCGERAGPVGDLNNWAFAALLLSMAVFGATSTTTFAASQTDVLFNGTSLAGWAKPTGEWMVAQAVSLDPANPRKFAIESGQGVLVNGPSSVLFALFRQFQKRSPRLVSFGT